ncbi:hypothetical protein Tco_1227124 [Tanacetum coccineum]
MVIVDHQPLTPFGCRFLAEEYQFAINALYISTVSNTTLDLSLLPKNFSFSIHILTKLSDSSSTFHRVKKIEHDDIALLTSSVTQLYTSVFLVRSKSRDIKVSDTISKVVTYSFQAKHIERHQGCKSGSNTTYTYINEALNCQTTSQHWLEKKAEKTPYDNKLRMLHNKLRGSLWRRLMEASRVLSSDHRYVQSCHPQVRKTNVLCVTTGKALETTSYNTNRVKGSSKSDTEIIDDSTSRRVSNNQRVGSTSSQPVNNLDSKYM